MQTKSANLQVLLPLFALAACADGDRLAEVSVDCVAGVVEERAYPEGQATVTPFRAEIPYEGRDAETLACTVNSCQGYTVIAQRDADSLVRSCGALVEVAGEIVERPMAFVLFRDVASHGRWSFER